MPLEMLVHLWKEAVINKAFVLHGPSDQKTVHVRVTRAIPGIIVDDVHVRELASVLNTAMVLHKNNAQERSNAGRSFHNKMKLKMDASQRFSLQQGIGTPFCECCLMHVADPSQCKSNSYQ